MTLVEMHVNRPGIDVAGLFRYRDLGRILDDRTSFAWQMRAFKGSQLGNNIHDRGKGGREMLASGPPATNPSHPCSSVDILFYNQFILLLQRALVISSMWFLVTV